MKKARKAKKETTFPAGRKTWLALLSVAIAPMVIGTCFAANASNGLLQTSAIKAASDKFESPARTDPAKQELYPAANEAMPKQAKAVKTREEAKQLIAQVEDSNSAITYDPWGRIAKIVEPDSSVRQFVYSGDRLCEERDGTGAVTKRFFNWGEIIGSTKYFYTRDHLGSVTEMTDESGNIVAQYKYDPFGNVTRIAGTGPDSDFLYAGYFYHKPSGLYITRHRLYSPKLGRWLNHDPIDDPMFDRISQNPEGLAAPENESAPGAPLNPNFLSIHNAPKRPIQVDRGVPQVPNPYTYVDNNPISKVDPSGLKAEDLGPTPCPQCINDCDVNPANCRLTRRWSEVTQQWLYTIVFTQTSGKVCTAYGYNGWPDSQNGYCKWLCN